MTTSATPITPPSRVSLSRTSGLALLVLLALVLSASLPGRLLAQAAPPPSAESRLEALRNALLERALKAPARLRSAAWIDESGTLRENLQIQSDVKLRVIRVLSYLEEGRRAQGRRPGRYGLRARQLPGERPSQAPGATQHEP